MNRHDSKSSESQSDLRRLSNLAHDSSPDSRANIAMLESIVSVFDGLGQAVVVTKPDGRIVHVSRAAEQTTGYSGPELAGRFLKDLSQPDRGS